MVEITLRTKIMKLAIINTILTPYRIPIYDELHKQTGDVAVLTMMHHKGEQREWDLSQYPYQFKHKILPGLQIPRKNWPFPLSINFGVMPTLWRLNADVVLSGGGFALTNIAAFVYCKLSGKKFVNWCEFTMQDGSDRSAAKRFIRRTLSRHADASIASSSDSRDAFLHFGAEPENVRVVVMPIDVDFFHETAKAFRASAEYDVLKKQFPGPVMIVIARLGDAKGFPELFKAYEQVVASRPDATLLIVGNGPKRKEYETLACDKGWRNVHFLGFLEPPDVARYLAVSDFSVFPTLNDSFGAVAAEAMAAQLPVLSSVHAYATRDLVDDGETGYRIDPYDTATTAEKILLMVEMEEAQRKAMGLRAYEKVRRHDCATAAREVCDYLTLIAGKGR